MKYILAQQASSGFFLPFIFPDEVPHSHVKYAIPEDCHVVGAGFIRIDEETGEARCCGKAESLKGIQSPSDIDQQVITLFMSSGLSGMQLNNMIMILHHQQQDPGTVALPGFEINTSSLLPEDPKTEPNEPSRIILP